MQLEFVPLERFVQILPVLWYLILLSIQPCRKKLIVTPLPTKYYTENKVRKYGAHGTSHQYVAGEAAKLLGKPLEELKLITCHVGNGVSVTAVDKGISVDTSMGFTPLGGVMMGTRTGDLDPAIIPYLMEQYRGFQ